MLICIYCGKSFTRRSSLSIHFNKTEQAQFESALDREYALSYACYGKDKVDSLISDYKAEKLSSDGVSKLANITPLLVLLGIKRTASQEKLTYRYKEKYAGTLRERYGENVTNISQLDFVKVKKKEAVSVNYGSYSNYLEDRKKLLADGFKTYVEDDLRLKETVKKIENTCLSRYGNSNFGGGEAAKLKNNISRKALIDSWTYEERLASTSKMREKLSHRGGYSSKPEKRVRHALTELGIDFKSNVHLWNFNFDMVFSKFIIEVQGDMWHANPLFYKSTDLIMGKLLASDLWAKDKRKLAKAVSNGYTVVYIWECELAKLKDAAVVSLVKQKLIEVNYDFI